ncbi:MAG: glycoside hydrolase family 3 C-terminal domain-containing protein [Oscillospiraceae bacterium]|nr:glycoside hydrolase family 3 C-terminal domain-containing protein [Oscillospiraceae bacterium]
MDTACSFIVEDTDEIGFKDALKKMKKADKIVLAIGEHQMYSGEGRSRAKIVLPKTHLRLVEVAKQLNKPVIAVVYTGRPLELELLDQLCDGILLVWQPGTEGGNAIANLLYGKANPCGKLSMSFPYSTAQLPIYYNHLSTGRPKKSGDELPSHPSKMPFTSMYNDVKNEPLYPFGFGLSYSEFKLSNLKLSKKTMSRNEKITASVEVENYGKYDGKEVVELYLRDKFASVSRPVKELKGFKKIFLKAGEKQVISFEISEEMLRFYNQQMQFVSENGEFDIMISNGITTICDTFSLI